MEVIKMKQKLINFKNYLKTSKIINKAFGLTMVIALGASSMAYAGTENGWAKNGSDWIRSGVSYAAMAIVAFYAMKHLLKRQFMQFIGFAVLAAFVFVIIGDPSKLASIGNTLYNTIFG
jgi:hypothetical protein